MTGPAEPTIALCNDCLRVLKCDDLVPDANDPPGRCPHCVAAGRYGTTCNCPGCLNAIDDLKAGRFGSGMLLLQPSQVVSWSAEGGIVERPA